MWSNIMVKSPALAPMTAARDDPFAVAAEPSRISRHFGLPFLLTWIARSRERRAVADLAESGRLLRDVGLMPAQALREAAKPFWRS